MKKAVFGLLLVLGSAGAARPAVLTGSVAITSGSAGLNDESGFSLRKRFVF